MCKFNLVVETQSLLTFKSEKYLIDENKFFSEKTLKALMVSTPAYVLLQHNVYHSLKDYGFYFLNEEFAIQQSKEEIEEFVDVLLKNKTNVCLEIGLGHYGSTHFLWC